MNIIYVFKKKSKNKKDKVYKKKVYLAKTYSLSTTPTQTIIRKNRQPIYLYINNRFFYINIF